MRRPVIPTPSLALPGLLACALAAPGASAGELRGRLVLDGGKPAAGVTVAAVPHETPHEAARRQARGQAEPAALAQVTSGADGAFVLALPSEPGKARDVVFQTRGAGTIPSRSLDVYSTAEAEDVGEIPLVKGQALAGKVVGPSGKPVPGAVVTLHPARRPRDSDAAGSLLLPVRVTTGGDGTFRFDAAGPGPNRLTVEAAGLAPLSRTGVRPGALHRPLALAEGVAMIGRVLRPGRKGAAPGALVRVEGSGTTGWVEAKEDGSFSIPAAPRGKVRLVADADLEGQAEVSLVLPLAEGRTAEVVLSPASGIEGRAVNARTLAPVARVKVRVDGEAGTLVTRTGPDGKYRLRPLRPGTYRLLADERRHVPFRKDEVGVGKGETARVDLPLVLGATLAGRVVDENGAPVPGAAGRVSRRSEGGIVAFLREVRGEESPSFRTRPDGTFVATRLSPGDSLRLLVSHPDFQTATSGGLSLVSGGSKQGLVVTMRRGNVVSGRVLDLAESPVAGAGLELTRGRTFEGGRGGQRFALNLLDASGGRPVAATGADGRFEIRGLTPGDYSLRVRKAGYATEVVDPVKVGDGSEPLAIVLGPGASITGRVVRKSGDGVEGVRIAALPKGAGRVRPRDTLDEPTGPDGFFAVDGLKPGESYDLTTFRPTGPGPEKKDVPAPSEGVEILVPGGGGVKGTVVDAESGNPVTEFDVSYEADRPGARGGMVIRMVTRGPGGGRERGTHVESEDGAFLLEDVPPGTWQVSVDAKGYQAGRVGSVVVEEGSVRDGVEVKLAKGAVLSGRVTDARSGRAVPDATITKQASGEGGGRLPIPGLSGEDEVTTDADGRFSIEGVAPGTYKLTARHADYAEESQTVEVTERGGNAEIRLSTGGVVAGVVLSDARRPVDNVEVSLSSAGEGGFGRMLGGGPQTATDGTGRFRFDHLASGRYTVTAVKRGANATPVDVVLQAGESREDVTLTLSAGGTILGVVKGLAPEELTGVNVSASGSEGWFDSGRTDSSGSFRIEGAPAGMVRLQATAGDFRTGTKSASAEVSVPEGGGDVPAEIVFESRATLSGQVTRASAPLADAMVLANRRGGGRSGTGRTDESGSYRIEGLEDGTYNLVVAPGMSGSFGPKTDVVEVSGDTTHDVVVPTARLTGTVVESGTRRPLAESSVELEAAGGAPGGPGRFGASTDSNGRFTLNDLEPKSYTLTARKAGFEFEQRNVVPSEDGEDVLVELKRGEGIGIEVKDGIYGVPLRSVLVRASDANRSTVFSGTVPLDSDGRGEVPSLKPGRYTLFVDASGYAPRTIDGVSAPQPLVAVLLTPGGSVDVLVGPETRGLPNARGRLVSASGAPYALNAYSVEGWIPLAGTSQRHLQNVAPGAYTFAVEGGAAKAVTVTEGGRSVVELP